MHPHFANAVAVPVFRGRVPYAGFEFALDAAHVLGVAEPLDDSAAVAAALHDFPNALCLVPRSPLPVLGVPLPQNLASAAVPVDEEHARLDRLVHHCGHLRHAAGDVHRLQHSRELHVDLARTRVGAEPRLEQVVLGVGRAHLRLLEFEDVALTLDVRLGLRVRILLHPGLLAQLLLALARCELRRAAEPPLLLAFIRVDAFPQRAALVRDQPVIASDDLGPVRAHTDDPPANPARDPRVKGGDGVRAVGERRPAPDPVAALADRDLNASRVHPRLRVGLDIELDGGESLGLDQHAGDEQDSVLVGNLRRAPHNSALAVDHQRGAVYGDYPPRP